MSAKRARHAGAAVAPSPAVRERLRARLRGPALDRELASGAPERLNPALELRARVLVSPRMRARLCDQLRQIVGDAHQPARLSPHVPIRRREVVEAQDDLRLIASYLDSTAPVAVRGVAKVRVLLTDGCGPLYHHGSTEDLGAAVQQALAALS